MFFEYFKSDIKRYGRGWGTFFLHHYRFLFWLRLAQFSRSRLMRIICKVRLKLFSERFGLEIQAGTQIGKGFYIGHPFNITINPNVVIGNNVNVHKGVTIGAENRGRRKGTPIIGNFVWIGVNATIIGNITIGDDVLIAANSFVNTDIPSHSIVIGNPCIIHHKDSATDGYISNPVL